MKTCVNQITPTFRAADRNDPPCGLPATGYGRTHGFLCANHYTQQQRRIPAKPRLPQPLWKGLVAEPDDKIIADIIATDTQRIADGKIVSIKRGVLDPVYLHILEPPTVH